MSRVNDDAMEIIKGFQGIRAQQRNPQAPMDPAVARQKMGASLGVQPPPGPAREGIAGDAARQFATQNPEDAAAERLGIPAAQDAVLRSDEPTLEQFAAHHNLQVFDDSAIKEQGVRTWPMRANPKLSEFADGQIYGPVKGRGMMLFVKRVGNDMIPVAVYKQSPLLSQ
jgi:hypothetical protein